MNSTLTEFGGYPCLKLDNGAVSLWLITSAGPRIIGFTLAGGANVLAELPDATLDGGGADVYRVLGGHRLWHAPEDQVRTYVPDDLPPAIAEIENGVRVTQPVESKTGIEKEISVTLLDEQPRAVVDHKLTNHGIWPVELAPWAITQLKPGGLAILPQPTENTGLLPNRRLALWPYTNINSPHIHWGDRFIFIEAKLGDEALKIGWANPDGWLGYAAGGTLFVKEAPYHADAEYFDFGSSSECYCGQAFIELETLGPRVTLQPGESTTHHETWTLYADVDLTADEETAVSLVEKLRL
ncbi:MAG: hypothetical protein ACK2U0_18595 [Candidatus Promineifilaceae bacterium]|jgi:hypothetical protein